MTHKTELDSTMMSDFLYCRRAYNLRHNLGWRLKIPQTALTFGAAISKALDSWYTEKDQDKAIGVFKANYVEDLSVDDKRTNTMAKWILENYHTQYQDQPWELVSTEKEFSIELPNGNRHTGRVDKVIRWMDSTPTLWGVDHKTTSQLGAQYFNFAEPNLQFPGYTYALKNLGFNVRGFIVDAILVAKGLLPGKSKNPNLTPLARYDVYHKQENLDEWLEAVLLIHKDIKQCELSGTWCPNFTSCVGKYGDCQFRRVCKEEKDIRERVLQQDYEISFWNPLTPVKE